MPRHRYPYLRGNCILSPTANWPWVSTISLVIWLITGVTWPTGPEAHETPFQVLVTLLALFSYSFYAYKAIENGFLLFAPHKWWTVRLTGEVPRRRALAIFDILDLYVPYFLVTGVVSAALTAHIPAAFANVDLKEAPFEQLLRLGITTGLSSYGIGFTSIFPIGTIPEFVVYYLSISKLLIILVIFGSINSFVLEQTRRRLERERRARRDLPVTRNLV